MADNDHPMSNKADYDLPEGAKPLKTWSYLSDKKRTPSEYEVVSTHLLYTRERPDRPWNIGKNEPINVWYKKYGNDSPLMHDAWDDFRDPDEITYRAYNIMQDGQETYIDGLLEHNVSIEDDKGLSENWVKILASLYTPGRYVLHTMQMASNYSYIIAPASTVALCSAFQAADQLRWVSRIAYRTVELSRNQPGYGFNEAERGHWENDDAWQGFRELMEKLLIAYDWGETFTALNLVAKPAVDETFFRQFAHVSRGHGDTLFGLLAEAALRDSDRSRRWAAEFVHFMQEVDGNQAHLEKWVEKWLPLANAGIDAFCSALPDGDAAATAAKRDAANFRKGLGFKA